MKLKYSEQLVRRYPSVIVMITPVQIAYMYFITSNT